MGSAVFRGEGEGMAAVAADIGDEKPACHGLAVVAGEEVFQGAHGFGGEKSGFAHIRAKLAADNEGIACLFGRGAADGVRGEPGAEDAED